MARLTEEMVIARSKQSDLSAIKKLNCCFYRKFKLPGVIGCIDGTHVAIIRPSQHEERYFNRKGYHSLNVMIICDADLNILCIDPSKPGATHDSSVWRDHPLQPYLNQKYDEEEIFLLGDSGYALRKTMMTPVLNAIPGSPEEHYYKLQVSARNTVERCIGVLKARFRGAELGDVSLLRRMPNVEVLAFSINKIRTLGDFAGCRRLRELYVRKNEINDLHEIRHLRHLPDLTSLWLDENPCTTHPQYRMTVLRNLPHLEKLDNVPVQPDEVQEAMRRGVHIPDSDDEGYPQQQESYGGYRRQRSCESSPEREPDQYYQRHPPRHEGSDSSEAGGDAAGDAPAQVPPSPVRRTCPAASPDSDERYDHPAMNNMTRSHYDARSPDAGSLRHSLSTHSVKEFSYSSNGECRYPAPASGVASPPYQEPYYERPDRSESYGHMSQRGSGEAWEERASARAAAAHASERDRDKDYPSAVMAEHRGFTRRPVARNSNLLSAVLCLVKELDYPSLEVAEMAVRCRMDELANSQ